MTHQVTLDHALANRELGPGVVGIAETADDGCLVVGFIAAVEEGSGDVGRWLDSLVTPVCFPCVVNDRLAAMLARRGFVEESRDRWIRGVPIGQCRYG